MDKERILKISRQTALAGLAGLWVVSGSAIKQENLASGEVLLPPNENIGRFSQQPEAVSETQVLFPSNEVTELPFENGVDCLEIYGPAPEYYPDFLCIDVPEWLLNPPEVMVDKCFTWPVNGILTTYFGERRLKGYHKGIDIDQWKNYGNPVKAASDGKVELTAYDDWGLGYHVILDHGSGIRSVYGHLSEIWVNQGDKLEQEETVGAAGSTGYSKGPHLHFELWYKDTPVDPLKFLPMTINDCEVLK